MLSLESPSPSLHLSPSTCQLHSGSLPPQLHLGPLSIRLHLIPPALPFSVVAPPSPWTYGSSSVTRPSTPFAQSGFSFHLAPPQSSGITGFGSVLLHPGFALSAHPRSSDLSPSVPPGLIRSPASPGSPQPSATSRSVSPLVLPVKSLPWLLPPSTLTWV